MEVYNCVFPQSVRNSVHRHRRCHWTGGNAKEREMDLIFFVFPRSRHRSVFLSLGGHQTDQPAEAAQERANH